ncbi:MAG: hypothetical protein ACFFB5_17770 [Promethearchaeota archaeon]
MGRPSLLPKKNYYLAFVHIGLISIFFLTCVVVPAFRLLPFFEWKIFEVNNTFMEIKQWTTRCYFDGITRSTTYSNEFYADTFHEYSFKELKRDYTIYEIFPKLSGEYLEVLTLSGMGMILLGTIIFGLKLGLNYYLWQSKKQIHSWLYHGSSIVAILVIVIHWTLLILAFVGNPTHTYLDYSTMSFIVPPTPNLVLVFLMAVGIVSLVISDHIESIQTHLKKT